MEARLQSKVMVTRSAAGPNRKGALRRSWRKAMPMPERSSLSLRNGAGNCGSWSGRCSPTAAISGGMLLSKSLKTKNKLRCFWATRQKYDPDLWIIELDVASAERFAAEMNEAV